MQYSRLGNSGLKVSRLCLGMMSYGSSSWRQWVLDASTGLSHVKKAIELGINFFDTADMYSQGESERVLGMAVKEHPRRDELVIASKVYFPIGTDMAGNNKGLSRKHITFSIDETLKRLGTDYVDLYQIHRFDPDTPIRETMQTLNDLIRCGKVRYIGGSSMYTWHFLKMQYTAEMMGLDKFVSMQNHYNLLYREEEREMNPCCVSEGVGLLPWSPLARGFLTGNRSATDRPQATTASNAQKSPSSTTAVSAAASPAAADPSKTLRQTTDGYAHDMYYEDVDFKIAGRVRELATKKGKTSAQIALGWLLHRPGVVSPIIGCTKISQLEDAVGALSVSLNADDMKFLEELYTPRRILGHS